MHIGLIGGIGPAATEFYYRNLVRAHAAAGRALDLTIAHADLRDLVRNMADDATDRQAQIFLRLVRRLQAAGAAAAAVTSIAGHFCIRELRKLSPLPIIDAIPELEAELVRRGLKRVGLVGTRVVMGSRLFGGISAIDVVVPQGDAFDATHDAYVAMATAGQASDQQRELMFSVGSELCRRQGAEAVVLAGTDLFLAFEGRECGFPTIDCARVHIDALLRESMTGGRPKMKAGRGGVEFEDLALGEGPTADRGRVVSIRYDVFLNRGDKVRENQVCSFRLGERRVIPGLEYGVEGMRVGGRRRLRVGAHLAYGAEGVPGVVPANAVLEFDVTLSPKLAVVEDCVVGLGAQGTVQVVLSCTSSSVSTSRMPAISPLRRPDPDLGALVAESEQAGLRFVRRLAEEWASGANRFDRPGEALFGAWVDGRLVGVCGLNADPYSSAARVGRVRHLYVLSSFRRRGVGRRLIAEVIGAARGPFDTLRLRTDSAGAARLYEALGFRRADRATDCTHVMDLGPAAPLA